jgi:hypothetical protein
MNVSFAGQRDGTVGGTVGNGVFCAVRAMPI